MGIIIKGISYNTKDKIIVTNTERMNDNNEILISKRKATIFLDKNKQFRIKGIDLPYWQPLLKNVISDYFNPKVGNSWKVEIIP